MAAIGLLASACGQPPLRQLEMAEKAMQRAAASGGVLRAPQICAEAQAALARAEAEIRVQRRKASWSRRYHAAEKLVAAAVEAGESCAAHAAAVEEGRRRRAGAALDDLESALGHATALARHTPDENIQSRLLRATMSLNEGRASFKQGEYERAGDAAGRGRALVGDAVKAADAFIDGYRANPRTAAWRRWLRATLLQSQKEKRTVILVDKLRRQLLVVRGDDELASFRVDLGLGGMEHKSFAGDAFTPEGRYRITEVRAPGQTRYYRALMLDYPNEEDLRRFRALKQQGLVPRRGGAGSNIEIHGAGGREQDWTQGCVALSNDDMDALVGLVQVGTPVTIVGTIPDGEYE
ncbi:MAG TPA: L,D-transpeptidase [Verrucomicrobiae bacterium]|nr:L,D-transpeptidase [Verrucomicrobiae bacterium]